MKNFLLSLLAFFALSCVSTKYNVDKTQGNFDQVKAGTKYKVYDLQDQKSVVTVTSVESDSIRGIRNDLPFAIAKKDIKEVKKNKNGATALLIGGSAALLVVSAVGVAVGSLLDGGQ